ncbi:MAG TPA: ribbon-helix-helix domain-containing protein [Candidatus Methylomirabilis sp.]|nr:ribbon-helix-helix domain-containing protein [Candidatus Methylomirabilis sp.]
MTRVQVLLTEEQDRRLESLARRMRVSKTRLVREGVDLVLQRMEQEWADPLLSLVGQAGRVGRKDVSARHDAFLAATERRRNR